MASQAWIYEIESLLHRAKGMIGEATKAQEYERSQMGGNGLYPENRSVWKEYHNELILLNAATAEALQYHNANEGETGQVWVVQYFALSANQDKMEWRYHSEYASTKGCKTWDSEASVLADAKKFPVGCQVRVCKQLADGVGRMSRRAMCVVYCGPHTPFSN
jgi:hypothetical protein